MLERHRSKTGAALLAASDDDVGRGLLQEFIQLLSAILLSDDSLFASQPGDSEDPSPRVRDVCGEYIEDARPPEWVHAGWYILRGHVLALLREGVSSDDAALHEFVEGCARQLEDVSLDGTESGYMTARGMEVLGLQGGIAAAGKLAAVGVTAAGSTALESSAHHHDVIAGRYWLQTTQYIMEAWRLHCNESFGELVEDFWKGISSWLWGAGKERGKRGSEGKTWGCDGASFVCQPADYAGAVVHEAELLAQCNSML